MIPTSPPLSCQEGEPRGPSDLSYLKYRKEKNILLPASRGDEEKI